MYFTPSPTWSSNLAVVSLWFFSFGYTTYFWSMILSGLSNLIYAQKWCCLFIYLFLKGNYNILGMLSEIHEKL